MIGLHDSRNQTCPSVVPGPTEEGSSSPFLLLCRATENTRQAGLLSSRCAWAIPSSHPWSSYWHTSALSPHCQGALAAAAAAAAAAASTWCQGQLTLKASHSLSCVLCSQRERLKDLFFFLTWNWHLSACFGQAAAALLWAYCKCLHWYLAGVSLQASRKGVGLSPGFRILSEETKGIFRPCRHRVLGGTFPKCGSHLHILSSPPVSSCILVLCPEASD